MTIILYLVQVTTCLAIFYGFYHLFLRKETLFHTNRMYLMSTLIVSLILPAVKIYVDAQQAASNVVVASSVYVGNYMHQFSATISTPHAKAIPWFKILGAIYLTGVAVMATRLLLAFKQILEIRKEGEKSTINGHTCVLSEKVRSPFSFFNTIYLPTDHDFNEDELNEVIAHEMAHVSGWHTWDVLLMELLCVKLWPSPMIYLYRKSLKEVHEYVADAAVLKETPWENYAQLLVSQQHNQLQNILSNQLIYSQLKKRLLMMNKERSGFAARYKYLGFIPVLLVALLFFSFREKPISVEAQALSDHLVQETDTVILYLTDDKRVFIGSQEVSKDEIELKVMEATKGMSDPVVIVMPENSKEVTVGELADIMQVGTKMHMNWIGLIDDEGKFDAFKSAIKDGDFVFTGDTLDETTVVAYRKNKLLPAAVSSLQLQDHESPVFPGCRGITASEQDQCGTTKLWEYINANLVYPEPLRKAGIQGVVVVKFTVSTDGLVKDVSISKSLQPDADDVVMKIVNDMNTKVGKWQPAMKEGKPIDAELCLPVKFALNDDDSPKEVLTEVDELPRFPGCEHIDNADERNACASQKLFEFIYSNIKYPKEARDRNVEGMGIIQFVVNEEGSISDIKVVRSPGIEINEELLRIMNTMAALPGKWVPARKEGKPVAFQFTLPVKFKLQDDDTAKQSSTEPATEAVKQNTVEVFPNPARETISVSIFEGAHTLKVFDTSGNLVMTQKIPSDLIDKEKINVWGLKPGHYVVQVIGEGKTQSGAFTVVK